MADQFYREQALESIAIMTLKQYNNGILINGDPQAIPIEYLIEKQFGLTIEYHHIRKDLRVLGQTVFEDSYTIVYDPDARDYTLIDVTPGTIIIDTRLTNPRYENRYRFSLAHELAHWILHKGQFIFTGESAALLAKIKNDILIERQADHLCASLLLPYGQVKRAFYRLQSRNSRDAIIAQMAQTFKVAPKTMEIRLTEHGLI